MGLIEPVFTLDGRGSPHSRNYLALTQTGRLVLKFESDRYHEAAALARFRLRKTP